MKAYNDDLTISMVSFFSDEIIKKALKEIPEEYKILVTDNALSNTLKKNLETSFKMLK